VGFGLAMHGIGGFEVDAIGEEGGCTLSEGCLLITLSHHSATLKCFKFKELHFVHQCINPNQQPRPSIISSFVASLHAHLPHYQTRKKLQPQTWQGNPYSMFIVLLETLRYKGQTTFPIFHLVWWYQAWMLDVEFSRHGSRVPSLTTKSR
jgi:hypothetical protein